MNLSFLLTYLLIFVHFNLLSQSRIEVIVISSLPEDEKVFISGNSIELGNWNPAKVALNKINDSTWSRVFEFTIGETIEFKFTKGSWEEEAQDEFGKISGNKLLKVVNDSSVIFKVERWGSKNLSITGQITGEVRYHKNFTGRNVLPRDLIVWLPPSYESLPQKYYPVLYLQDGQNLFDPLTSSFGTDWQVDETADSLIKAKSIQELIIVGIYNTTKRGDEYNDTEIGSAYLYFIIEELKPFIDRTYRTLPDNQNTAIGGSSSGGLISFIMAWEHPDVFSKAACLSPAFKIQKIDYVAPIKKYKGARKDILLYIDNGGMSLEDQLQPGIDEMLIALKEKGFTLGGEILYFKDSSAVHNEAAWAKRVYRFLEFLFPIKE